MAKIVKLSESLHEQNNKNDITKATKNMDKAVENLKNEIMKDPIFAFNIIDELMGVISAAIRIKNIYK